MVLWGSPHKAAAQIFAVRANALAACTATLNLGAEVALTDRWSLEGALFWNPLRTEEFATSFRAVQCQSRTPWRNVMHINVTRHGPYVVVDIKANAFVHHMVRNIVGSLMEVGAHNQPESWIAELLAAKDRTLAAATAKAEGLYLVAVDYPDRYDLPKPPMGPLFLAD